jgi:hypothetical protein
MKFWLCALCLVIFSSLSAQMQTCPANINFSQNNLTHWFAYTGNNRAGNGPTAIMRTYDSLNLAPNGTLGARTIYEYNLFPQVAGIQVITNNGKDLYGGFPTIPTINGYKYNYAILLGSTSITRSGSSGAQGGYIRGISYKINVPSSASSQPYTMTYAYAMVLENGTHDSYQQPKFSATLTTNDSIINCASPSYYLPTFNDVAPGQIGATLDSATAFRNGFTPSLVASPNLNPNPNIPGAPHLHDIWTKGWTEVTFDLSPYRGQQVTLTFESDNCIPGGHFAYAYIALRNSCAGLVISGDSLVCVNSSLTYSVPALAGASYEWLVPSTWQIVSDSANTNILKVISGTQKGLMIVREQNSCTNLVDTLQVNTSFPGVGGKLNGDATVCSGINSQTLLLSGNVGNVRKWISSPDGINWSDVANTSNTFTPQNLTATTIYRVLVQNGTVCAPDSSSPATLIVDQKSKAGILSPLITDICKGQNLGGILTLGDHTGKIVNWQSSQDNINWQDIPPQNTDSIYSVVGLGQSSQFRAIVKNGVCDPDTSSIAGVKVFNTPFPQAFTDPADTTICYGEHATLHALITIGNKYTWTNTSSLINEGNGSIGSSPFSINAQASPLTNSDYVLSIQNGDCPNLLLDTFHVKVLPQIFVNPGRDTNIVANQPLQLQASSSDTTGDLFTWLPVTGLNNPGIPNPVAILDANIDSVRYIVRATTPLGCHAENHITVRIFKTGPDIFVPNAFTQGKNINSLFRPIPVGISSLQFFRVYDRWGRLVYSTSQIGQGWDGTIGGRPQDSDSFVWMVGGTDYRGKTIFKKGTMVLIR